LKTLLIDNYDSFTYNLFQLLGEVNGEEPLVVRNDEASWDELAALECDNVVISPGPGRPDREDDFGVCADALRRAHLPLLGVCLGHQGLGAFYGAAVVASPEPFHGRLSAVLHDDSPLFAGIPREFQAVRYHSLCVEQPLPAELRGIAWTSDGVLMAVEHRKRPLWGVQFHPESVCTEHGRRLLANFRDLSMGLLEQGSGASREARRGAPPACWVFRQGSGLSPHGFPRGEKQDAAAPEGHPTTPSPQLQLVVKRLDLPVDSEGAFTALYGKSENAFWLDSSRVDQKARFSFMGDDAGSLGAIVRYDVGAGEVRVARRGETEVR
jgi:para-aminobenzoate synthetase